MAKDAHDREDLLRDASAFTSRIEFAVDEPNNRSSNVFCGFRDNGALSVFWGQDTVLQFNTSGELRRAFWREQMVATYKHEPHWLKSDGNGRVRLRRIVFTAEEKNQFAKVATEVLAELSDLIAGDPVVVGQVPEDANLKAQIHDWLREHATLKFALHPGVGK